MADTIKTNIEKPKENKGGDVVGRTIEYGITTPKSGFDRRPAQGGVSYVGDSQMETRQGGIKEGESQKKKHKSTGRGQ